MEKKEYFDSLPRKIKRYIMRSYLYADVFDTHNKFISSQKNYDESFIYDLAFGFQPRMFDGASHSDRFIYEEGDHAAEMYFIMSGHWAVGYNIFAAGIRSLRDRLKVLKEAQMDKYYRFKGVSGEKSKAREAVLRGEAEVTGVDMKEDFSTQLEKLNDIREAGLVVALDFITPSYIGDYYLFAQKPSEYYWMAIDKVEAYAISADFFHNELFSKYKDLREIMLGQAHEKYRIMFKSKIVSFCVILFFRKPTGKKESRSSTLSRCRGDRSLFCPRRKRPR